MTAIVSDKPKPSTTELPAPAPYEETDDHETELHYGPGRFSWFPRVLWLGGAILFVWYVAAFYVPSLRVWISWKPSP